MEEILARLRANIEESLREAGDLNALEALRVKMLGRKGEVTQLLKTLGELEPDERRHFGQLINNLRNQVEEGMQEARAFLISKDQAQNMERETLDVTLPGKPRVLGHRHPLMRVFDEMTDFFIGLGFTIAEGPHIETDYYNFEALNVPKHHSTRDEQDTFYINENFVLRTHTSPVQVRVMESHKPPIRIIAPGKTFRSDDIDATHTPVFHQLEGLVIDKGIHMGDLKGTLELLVRRFFGENARIRFRPSYFPFTEPSAEVDATCHVCGGEVPAEGCRVCKDSGWIELWGCGMVHPRVLEMSGIDPLVYSGYAFGLGVDRITSLLYGITDPRLYFENDMQFLSQV
jgi:phenylalanyl-tRNA synthetase alpha chain